MRIVIGNKTNDKKYNLKVIEDAAELIGQTYKGKPCGSFGDVSTFSFYANKHITTGEGGAILTNSFQLDNKILSITKNDEDYIIKSAFINKENLDIFAIINVVATKQNGKIVLTNYQKILTKNWKTKTVGSITYHYFPEYQINEENALKANEFLNTISSTFELKNEKINYFIFSSPCYNTCWIYFRY